MKIRGMGIVEIKDERIVLIDGEAWMKRGALEREMKKGKKYRFKKGTDLETEGNISLQIKGASIGALKCSGGGVQRNVFN